MCHNMYTTKVFSFLWMIVSGPLSLLVPQFFDWDSWESTYSIIREGWLTYSRKGCEAEQAHGGTIPGHLPPFNMWTIFLLRLHGRKTLTPCLINLWKKQLTSLIPCWVLLSSLVGLSYFSLFSYPVLLKMHYGPPHHHHKKRLRAVDVVVLHD